MFGWLLCYKKIIIKDIIVTVVVGKKYISLVVGKSF